MFFKIFFLVLFLFSLAISQGRVDGVIAIVGDNIILHSDVLQQSQIVAASRGIDPAKRPYLFEEIYSATLDNIIDQLTVLDVAEKDTNLVVSDDEVDRALNNQIEAFILQAGSEESFVDAVGMSMRQIKAEYWKEVRNMMVMERYQFSKIQNIDISRTEVIQFFNSFKDSIPPVPESFDFSMIEVPFIAGEESENDVYSFLNSLKDLVVSKAASFDSLAIV